MTLSPVLLEASEPGRDLNLAPTVLVVVFKMAQSLECVNEGFFEYFKSFISSLHSLVYLFII